MRSSYTQNNYGDVLRAIAYSARPRLAVELGVLDGYSTVHIGHGLREVRRLGGGGRLDAYDLFDEYAFKHGSYDSVKGEVLTAGLSDVVEIHRGDAYQVHSRYQPREVGMLHVDISNTGETVRRILELWDDKIDTGGVVCFEGGTEERDRVEWMVKYGKPPIKAEIEGNPIIEKKYVAATYLPFPGLTVLLKKND